MLIPGNSNGAKPFWPTFCGTARIAAGDEFQGVVKVERRDAKPARQTQRARCLVCGYTMKLRADNSVGRHFSHPASYRVCHGTGTNYWIAQGILSRESVLGTHGAWEMNRVS